MIRRHFLGRFLAVAGTLLALPRAARAEVRRSAAHPTPRPGITAAKMMTPEQLERYKSVADAFEGVRAIPQIADGIRCHCGCADIPGYYSLLTCYEGTSAMALTCPICAGEGRMTARLFKEGQTLEQIQGRPRREVWVRVISRQSTVASVLVTVIAAMPVGAQIRASERASVSQTIDGTKMTLDFARPRVRGRAPMFGPRRASIVHWGEVWTPGANYATTLEINKAITLEGRQLAAGKYSLWLIPREGGPWTMVFDPDHHRFHTEMPDSNAAQIRVPVRPTTGSFEEALSFAFNDLAISSTNLTLAWGTMRVTMAVKVTPSMRLTVPPDEAAPYLGTYEWRYTDGDSLKSWILTVRAENGYMRGVLAPEETWPGDFAFIRLKPDREWFHLGIYDKGELYEIETTWVAEFTRGADGKVNGFVIRNDQDKIDVRARKRP